jgi:hypothetical protein
MKQEVPADNAREREIFSMLEIFRPVPEITAEKSWLCIWNAVIEALNAAVIVVSALIADPVAMSSHPLYFSVQVPV